MHPRSKQHSPTVIKQQENKLDLDIYTFKPVRQKGKTGSSIVQLPNSMRLKLLSGLTAVNPLGRSHQKGSHHRGQVPSNSMGQALPIWNSGLFPSEG